MSRHPLFIRRTPATFGPNEEFQSPSGEWFNIYRAISMDNWLIWKDALPEEHHLWSLLDRPTYENIKGLGSRLHEFHQLLPDYRRLNQSPFTVSRWWDPSDTEGWEHGGTCLLKIDGYACKQLPLERCPALGLQARAVSSHWVEFSRATPGIKPPEEAPALP